MNRIVTAAALALSLVSTSAVVLAAPAKAPAARHERGDMDKKFPMKADEFRQHVNQRVSKARERLNEHLTKKQVPADKASELRQKFDAGVARLNEKVNAVCADGTVTLDEAKEVRSLVHEMMPHKKGNHGQKSAQK